jgi:5-methyltetrahydrofolate--homocysteine methyltransferase
MTRDFSDFLGRIVITDGAMGTQLSMRGLPAGACPDSWNADNPEAVEAVGRAYVQAGAEVILSNTLNCSRFGLAHWDLGDRARELAARGAAIARKAAGASAAVFGSLGPSGKILMMGQVSPEELLAAFADAAAGLAEGGADAIVCETFTDLDEAVLAVQAAARTKLSVVLSMTFDSGPDRTATMMGQTPADAAREALKHGAAAVGANCGAGPENYLRVARLFKDVTHLPIWIKPNAGLPIRQAGKTVFPMNPEQFAQFAPGLVQAGASFIGGCCGTSPEHIRLLREAVDAIPQM